MANKKEMNRRSAIEPKIGHQKTDRELEPNWPKGVNSDAQDAVLSTAGHNLRKILAHLMRLISLIWA